MQVTLGFSIIALPYAGLIHGANALAIVAAASVAALRVQRAQRSVVQEHAVDGITV